MRTAELTTRKKSRGEVDERTGVQKCVLYALKLYQISWLPGATMYGTVLVMRCLASEGTAGQNIGKMTANDNLNFGEEGIPVRHIAVGL